jgi:hypothetical protein
MCNSIKYSLVVDKYMRLVVGTWYDEKRIFVQNFRGK